MGLPATSQLEHVDLHKAYGHRNLQFNAPAIAPLGEAKSNWDVIRLLAEALGYDELWLRQSGEGALAESFAASQATNPTLGGIPVEPLVAQGPVPLSIPPGGDGPFRNLRLPPPSARVEVRRAAL